MKVQGSVEDCRIIREFRMTQWAIRRHTVFKIYKKKTLADPELQLFGVVPYLLNRTK